MRRVIQAGSSIIYHVLAAMIIVALALGILKAVGALITSDKALMQLGSSV